MERHAYPMMKGCTAEAESISNIPESTELFFFEGLSQSEIARRLGVSQQVIQKRIFGDARNGVLVGGGIAKLRKALARFT